MIRVSLLVLLFVRSAVAYDSFAYELDLDYPGAGLHFVAYAPTGHDEFSLGSFNRSWDESRRYELLVTFDDVSLDLQRGWYGAAYLFWEDRRYEDDTAWLDAKAFGGGYEVGGRFWLIDPGQRPLLNLALSPYGRIGAAFQDVDFEGIETGSGSVYGGVDVERFEFLLGIDLLLRSSGGLFVSAGVVSQFWVSDQVGTTRDNSTVSTESFNGDSIFYRMSLGWRF